MDQHLSQLSNNVLTKGGLDAGNYNPDEGGALKRGYSQYIETDGGNSIVSATKRQNTNGTFGSFGEPSTLSSEGTLPGGPYSSQVLNSMQDGVENSEPKITHQLLIKQENAVGLINGDYVFSCPIGPHEAEKVPNKFKGHPIKFATGDLNILTPIKAFNLAQVNYELKEYQVNKLKAKKIQSNDNIFHREVLGSPEEYIKLYIPTGFLYREIDANGGDSQMASLHWPTVRGAPTVGYTQTKHVSIIRQGSHWVEDLWGSDMIQGTGLFFVLKPTIIETDQYYEVAIDPSAAANKFTKQYLTTQGTKLVQRGHKEDRNRYVKSETFVVYQWLPAASSGSKHLSVSHDLQYFQHSIPPMKAFGHNSLVFTDVSILSAAYIQVGVVKHLTDMEYEPLDRQKMATNYLESRKRRTIEVNALPYQVQII